MVNSTQRFKGIVFDLDDTLYPQKTFKFSGFKAVAQWVGHHHAYDVSTVFDELCLIMKEKGPSYPRMFDELVVRFGMDSKLVHQMVRVFREHDPRIKCYPGVDALLLRLRKEYKTGILTDGIFKVQNGKIEALGLTDKVDEVLFSNVCQLEKPDKKLFEWFENKFGIPGKYLVYIGDNPAKDFCRPDMGDWTTIRVTTGEHSHLRSIRPSDFKYTIPSVVEIENYIS